MECGQITEYTGLKPYEQTDPNEIVKACNSSLQWMIENLTPELNAMMPDICSASVAGGLANFKGVCGEAGTPTSGFQKGWTVFKDNNFYYCLRNTDNCPPSADWTIIGSKPLKIGLDASTSANSVIIQDGISSLEDRNMLFFKVNNNNTGASTLKIADLDAKELRDMQGTHLEANYLLKDNIYTAYYDSANGYFRCALFKKVGFNNSTITLWENTNPPQTGSIDVILSKDVRNYDSLIIILWQDATHNAHKDAYYTYIITRDGYDGRYTALYTHDNYPRQNRFKVTANADGEIVNASFEREANENKAYLYKIIGVNYAK